MNTFFPHLPLLWIFSHCVLLAESQILLEMYCKIYKVINEYFVNLIKDEKPFPGYKQRF
jgi:hypothetical protein